MGAAAAKVATTHSRGSDQAEVYIMCIYAAWKLTDSVMHAIANTLGAAASLLIFQLSFVQAMDTGIVCDDSDGEVFEVSSSAVVTGEVVASTRAGAESCDQSSVNVARINSTSSSSCDDRHSKASSHASPEPSLLDGANPEHRVHRHHHHTVSGQTVEWRPMSSKSGGEEEGSGIIIRNSQMVRKTPTDDMQSPQDHNDIHDLAAPHSGTVTVMIDPPNDEEQLYAESADSLGSKLVFRCPSASEEENIDLFADLDDSDSEGEEAEGMALVKTCLLSR